MINSTINYFADADKQSLFFPAGIQEIITKLNSALGSKINIAAYPDATYKGRGLVNGLAFISEYQDTVLLPFFLLDLGCGFLTFKVEFSSNQATHWQQTAGELLDQIVNPAPTTNRILPEIAVADMLYNGLDAVDSTAVELTHFLNRSFKLDSSYVVPADEELRLLEDNFLAVTNTIELKSIYKCFASQQLSANNITEDDVIGFIHTGSNAIPRILAQRFTQRISDYCMKNILFSHSEFDEGIFGIPLNTELGFEYYQWLKAAMNYSLVNRYHVYLTVKNKLETNMPCKVSMLNDVIHCGVTEDYYQGKHIVKAFRGVQSIYQDTIRLLAGQRESITALITGAENANDYYNMCAHGTSYNSLAGYDYAKYLGTKESNTYLALAKQTFYNSEPIYEKCLAYTHNLLASLEYFQKIGLAEPIALLAPQVNVQNERIKDIS